MIRRMTSAQVHKELQTSLHHHPPPSSLPSLWLPHPSISLAASITPAFSMTPSPVNLSCGRCCEGEREPKEEEREPNGDSEDKVCFLLELKLDIGAVAAFETGKNSELRHGWWRSDSLNYHRTTKWRENGNFNYHRTTKWLENDNFNYHRTTKWIENENFNYHRTTKWLENDNFNNHRTTKWRENDTRHIAVVKSFFF